jgi:hypothetical protein
VEYGEQRRPRVRGDGCPERGAGDLVGAPELAWWRRCPEKEEEKEEEEAPIRLCGSSIGLGFLVAQRTGPGFRITYR